MIRREPALAFRLAVASTICMTAKPAPRASAHHSFWLWVLCLIGLDYFSTLAYQPSIGFQSAGFAAPLATVVVVLITFIGALPVYCYVAGRSPRGQGALGLLGQSVHGWLGKLLIVILLGFAATDFIITRTLSVADAAEHLIHNPLPAWQATLNTIAAADSPIKQLLPDTLWQRIVAYWNRQLVVTMVLSILGFLFWAIFRRGFRKRVVQLSVVIVAVYLLLTAVIVGSGLSYLAGHPSLLQNWWQSCLSGTDATRASRVGLPGWVGLAVRSLFAFPQMSLGLSGFELSMVVLPFIKTRADTGETAIKQRVAGVRKLLVTAAALMSLYLLSSTLVTTTLISPRALTTTGQAANRALAYLAHGGTLVNSASAAHLNPLFGTAFGTVYDLSTILILCLAGASVTMGLRDFVPQYLHHLGMELEWAHNIGAILHVFNCLNLIITVLFRASVLAQRGAYATSVLVLISSAALAVALDLRQKRPATWPKRIAWVFVLLTIFFSLSAVAAIFTTPSGLAISLCFVLVLLVVSIVSRTLRSMELRIEGFEFQDECSRFLWQSLVDMEFPILVPHRPGHQSLLAKEELIRKRHRLSPDVPIVFVEVALGDPSEFYQRPLLEVIQEDGRFIVRIRRSASVAHVLAAAALELSKVGKPPEIHFGWSNETPLSANMDFLLFGQGNVPWMVRELIRKAEPDPERRPPVVIG
jgi:hypothetical protein